MSEEKKERTFLGGLGKPAEGVSMFSSLSGQPRKESSEGLAAALSRIEELEKKVRKLEEERAKERVPHAAQEDPAAAWKKAVERLEPLFLRVAELERSLTSLRAALEQSRDKEELSRRFDAFEDIGRRLGAGLKQLEVRMNSAESFRAELSYLPGRLEALDEAARQIGASVGQLTSRVEAVQRELGPLPGRLDLVENKLISELSEKLRESWAKIVALATEFSRFHIFENRLARVEIKMDEGEAAVEESGTVQAAVEERVGSLEHRYEGAALELRAAWDMVDMMRARVDGWEKKMEAVVSEFNEARNIARRGETDLSALSDDLRDISSKTNNMWGRFTFVEKEFSGIRGKMEGLDTDRKQLAEMRERLAGIERDTDEIKEKILQKRETITQMKTQIQNMNALLGKIGA